MKRTFITTSPFYLSTDYNKKDTISSFIERKERSINKNFVYSTQSFNDIFKSLSYEKDIQDLLTSAQKHIPEKIKYTTYLVAKYKKELKDFKRLEIKAFEAKEKRLQTKIQDTINLKDTYKKYLNSLNEANKPTVTNLVKNKAGIYMFINKINKKFYIGKTSNLIERINHYSNITYLKNNPSKFNNALLKFKSNNFSFVLIENCNIKDLKFKEQFYIDMLKPQYNIRKVTCKSYFNKCINI
jgi:hypothetical protein